MGDDHTNSVSPTAPVTKAPAQWSAIVLVLVGLVLSIASFAMLRAVEFSRAQAEFTAEADRWRALIQEQLTKTVDSLRSVSALLDSSEEVTRAEFMFFTRTTLEINREILSIEWIPRVAAAERARFEQRARATGLTDFQIKDLAGANTFRPAGTRPEYYPIYYVEPLDANRYLLGFDYGGRPRRSAAMFQARDTGEIVTASGFDRPHRTVFAETLNVAMFLPRYVAGSSPTSPAERRARLEGFVAVIFEMNAVMQSAFDRFPVQGIAFQVNTLEHEPLLTEPVSSSATHTDRGQPAHGLQVERTLELPHLRFRLVARATPDFPESPNYRFAWSALGGGLVLTGLALGFLQSLRRQFAKREELEIERNRLFNLSPDLLCIAGFDGYFKQLSPAWERALGYSLADLMSKPFISFVHPEDVPRTEEVLRDVSRGTEILDFENRYRRRDGTWRWLEWRSISAPERQLVYASARDVTEQRETHRALERARRFAERATEVMPSVLYIDDLLEHRNVYVNRQGTLALGLPEKYFSSSGAHAVHELIHEEDLPRFLEHTARIQALADGEIAEVTYRMRHADGSWRWFHGRDAVFERDAEGRVRLAIGTATDITGIKDAELALRENSQRLDFVLTAANMGVWELNLDTQRIVWTEPLARLLGLSDEDEPKTFEDFLSLVHPQDREEERRRIHEAAADRAMYRSEFRLNPKQGSVRWIAALGKFIEDDSGRAVRLLGLLWDVTQQKQAERDRSRIDERMRQSQKMEALGALAGGIAHDFNNILTAINGNASLALHDLPPDHPVRVNIEEIHRGAMRATDLVSRILAFSRNEEPALRRVDLASVVEEAVGLLRATMPAMIDIRFRREPVPPVLADATQIHQVIMNLGANARDAMSPNGGVLTISLRQAPVDSRLVALAPAIHGEICVRLTVEDTGAGILPDDLDRIFEPFYTTKSPGHGTGMGLAMVHGIVRRHGGVILVKSQPGRGTRFDVFLPSAVQAVEPQKVSARMDGVRGNGERILYVDDEEPLVFLATRMLTRLGFQVTGHTDARQALSEFEQDPDRWDMVITDLGMPGMSGLDLASELLRIRPDLPVMLTSGYVRLEDAERARMIGAEDIVPKPNTVEEMAPIIVRRLAVARGARSAATREPPISL